MIQKSARIPFRNAETNGICSGKRIRRVVVTGSSPVSWSRFLTSSIVIQLRTGVRVFRRSSSSSASDRPPELAVGVDDDPGVAVRVRGDVVEEGEQVVDVGDEVGEDDVVEGLVAPRSSSPATCSKTQAGMALARELDHARADVDRRRPRAGSSAASRSPLPLPISSTEAPGRTIERVHRADLLVVAAGGPARG